MHQNLRLLLYRIGLLLAAYMAGRLLFLGLNWYQFRDIPAADIGLALLHGLRFDLSVAALLNGPFVLLSLLPTPLQGKRLYQRVLRFLFLFINLPFVWLNVADAAYFSFAGRRSTIALLGIRQDIAGQGVQLTAHYWPLVLLSLLLALLLALLYRFPRKPEPVSPRKVGYWLPLVLSPALVVLAIRGGVQLKPLRVYHAFAITPAALGHLTLNSGFTFIKSLTAEQVEEKRFFSTEAELLATLPLPRPQPLPPLKNPRPNVVILILESFGAEYTGIGNAYQGYTPFLDSLARHSLAFGQHHANGRRSIEALPALLAGIPSLMEEPYITSSYQGNTLFGLGNALLKHGYRTSFFHGAANGSMGFGNFSKIIGIEDYYGLNQYPDRARDFDGNWGIFDEPYLQYFAKTLSGYPEPFMSCLFTLSSHQPYTIPPQHQGRFPKGELPVHESIGYADYALRQFFKTAAQQPWYANTLFVLTGDHAQQNARPEYHHLLGDYRVPLLFFRPDHQYPPADTAQVSQHADLPASLLHYLGLQEPLLPFGKSVFDNSVPGKALLYTANQYYLVQSPFVAQLPEEGSQVHIYDYLLNPALNRPLPQDVVQVSLDQQLKAWVQLYNNGLRYNAWFRQGESLLPAAPAAPAQEQSRRARRRRNN